MSSIHLLENSLINKIAAGEVVERPASVVKELVENSIDAGATDITVEIKNGGIDMIKVSDNGRGIPGDEVSDAFRRHATSKIQSIEDLDDIMTLGFRGEALSSIASVSNSEMVTRTADSPTGTRIVINGGVVEKQEEAAANTGTVFTMKNLFYNTPARRKFLKKPATEGSVVSEAVTKLAMGHPDVAVKYINNGNTILQTDGKGDLRSVVLYIYGKETASKMLDVHYSKNGFSLDGLIAKPEVSRGNRSYENFFINGRYIKSSIVQNAAEQALKGKLMIGKFPVFILNLTVPEGTVDVNVHPTKLEVRFSDENMIYDIIYNAISKAVADINLIPKVTWDRPEKKRSTGIQFDIDSLSAAKETSSGHGAEKESGKAGTPGKSAFSDAMDKLYSESAKKESAEPEGEKAGSIKKPADADEAAQTPQKDKFTDTEVVKPVRKPFFTNYKIVGQIFSTYWIIESNNAMYMIDQHAAHERVLYEDLISKFRTDNVSSQQLLQPVAVNLSESEKLVLEENIDLLESFGFEIEEFGAKTYALRAVPYVFDSPGNISFFMDIIDALSDSSLKSLYDTKEDAIATMSCKAAVKGNNTLNYSEAQELIQKLLKLEDPFTCPHGRPTIIEMSKYELEKKFKRIQD